MPHAALLPVFGFKNLVFYRVAQGETELFADAHHIPVIGQDIGFQGAELLACAVGRRHPSNSLPKPRP